MRRGARAPRPRGGSGPGRARAGTSPPGGWPASPTFSRRRAACSAACVPLLLRLGELRVKVGELAVDFRELGLLLRRRHIGVGFELALLAEELELADRQELGVGRLLE